MNHSRILCVSTRWELIIMVTLGVVFLQMTRSSLHVAINHMVVKPSNSCNACSEDTPRPSKLFLWDEETQGIMFSAYYFGYVITHLPGGYLATRQGGNNVLGISFLLTGVLTLCTPLVASRGPSQMILVQFLKGICEGGIVPAIYVLLSHWAPPDERSMMSTFTLMGGHIGYSLANVLGGIILKFTNRWELIFNIYGGALVVWFFVLQLFGYDSPDSHPYIRPEEKQYLHEVIGFQENKKNRKQIPWRAILTSKPVWALVIGSAGHDWTFLMFTTYLPKFMHDAMKIQNPLHNGLISGFPSLGVFIISFAVSTACDTLLRNKCAPVEVIRKSFATISLLGPATGMICAALFGSQHRVLSISSYLVGMGFISFTSCSLKVNALELSTNHAGILMGLANACGCISGMLAPYAIGLLTTHRTLEEWKMVLWMSSTVLFSVCAVYVVFGSSERQTWDRTEADGTAKEVQNKNVRKMQVHFVGHTT